MSSHELTEEAPAPRLCHLIKWDDFDGYGFNLHAEKSKAGQYIGKVDQDSPAQYADLREGDCIVEVNGVNVANENHKQVVERIKAVPNETKLLVVDEEGKKWYKERKLVIKGTQPNVRYNKTPMPRPAPAGPNGHPETANGHPLHQEEEEAEVENREEEPEQPAKEVSEEEDRRENWEIPEDRIADGKKEEVGGSRSSTPQSGSKEENPASAPDSPGSGRSSDDRANGSEAEGSVDLNLNMSASEMRRLLAARKKRDPKKIQMDLKKKYDIIQQM